MVSYRDNGMAHFTLKLPPAMQEAIEAYAAEEKRKRSNAIIYLMDVGMDNPEHIEPDANSSDADTDTEFDVEQVDYRRQFDGRQ